MRTSVAGVIEGVSYNLFDDAVVQSAALWCCMVVFLVLSLSCVLVGVVASIPKWIPCLSGSLLVIIRISLESGGMCRAAGFLVVVCMFLYSNVPFLCASSHTSPLSIGRRCLSPGDLFCAQTE